MDRGYWVWLIRLASGSIQRGHRGRSHDCIRLRPTTTWIGFNDWLDWHEPSVGDLIRDNRHFDPRIFWPSRDMPIPPRKSIQKIAWPRSATRPFSPIRFTAGLDFFRLAGNTLVTELITRDRAGADLTERVDFPIAGCTWTFFYDSGIRIFQDQYPLMGNVRRCSLPKPLGHRLVLGDHRPGFLPRSNRWISSS